MQLLELIKNLQNEINELKSVTIPKNITTSIHLVSIHDGIGEWKTVNTVGLMVHIITSVLNT